MNDLINRLRDCGPPFIADVPELLMAEAADLIEHQASEIEAQYRRLGRTLAVVSDLRDQISEAKKHTEFLDALLAGDGALITGLKNDLDEAKKLIEQLEGVLKTVRYRSIRDEPVDEALAAAKKFRERSSK